MFTFNPFQGFKVTRQGTSKLAAKWIAVSPYSRVLSKENAIGIQLAQIGKAASGVVRFTCKLVYFQRKLIEKSTIDFLN